jgi:hypothetical protein
MDGSRLRGTTNDEHFTFVTWDRVEQTVTCSTRARSCGPFEASGKALATFVPGQVRSSRQRLRVKPM